MFYPSKMESFPGFYFSFLACQIRFSSTLFFIYFKKIIILVKFTLPNVTQRHCLLSFDEDIDSSSFANALI